MLLSTLKISAQIVCTFDWASEFEREIRKHTILLAVSIVVIRFCQVSQLFWRLSDIFKRLRERTSEYWSWNLGVCDLYFCQTYFDKLVTFKLCLQLTIYLSILTSIIFSISITLTELAITRVSQFVFAKQSKSIITPIIKALVWVWNKLFSYTFIGLLYRN